MLSEPPRQPKGKKGSSQYYKGHDGSISTCAFFNPRWKVPNVYIAVAWLLFLQEQIKFIIIYTISYIWYEIFDCFFPDGVISGDTVVN